MIDVTLIISDLFHSHIQEKPRRHFPLIENTQPKIARFSYLIP